MYTNKSTLVQLADRLVDVCDAEQLNYNKTVLPIKLTADCYIIFVTPKTNNCIKHGHCQVQQYYALTGGETIKIIKPNV